MLFEVWAPKATRVDLCLDDGRYEMSSSDGWFRAEVDAKKGDRYAFSLDGTDPLPDPRSRFQPDGVDGWSAVVDHEGFSWGDSGWRPRPLGEWVIYEAHIGTFTEAGTFAAAPDRLRHLVDLGVNAIELMPVAEFSGDHGWGYDGVDLYAPHHAYGTPDDLKGLVDACHSEGLAVIMDVVYNHLGPAGNYLSRFGYYFTDAYGTPWGDAVNFDDMDSGPVRDFFIENALMWLRDYHCDALRLDAVHAMLDQSATHFLEEMGQRVADLGAELDRPLSLIAESDLNAPRVVRSLDRGGYGMHAQWSDDLHHSLHALFTGERSGYYSDFGTVEQVAKGVKQSFVFDGGYSEHRRRVHGRPPEGLDGSSFLAYLQTHDQVGNRAVGERIGHLVPRELVKIGAALVLTSPFIPMLFQGEEWDASSPFLYFTDHRDPGLGDAVRKGRRREFASFGWNPEDVPDPQARETFLASKLKWDEVAEERHREMLDWYRELIRLRTEVPALGDPDLKKVTTRSSETPPWLIVERGDVTIACNLGDEEVELAVPEKRRWKTLLTSAEPTETGDSVRLPATSVTIWGGPAVVPGRLLL
jgi:maltooligosyltrehalose trehalohydrolase